MSAVYIVSCEVDHEKEIKFVGTKLQCYEYITNQNWSVECTIYLSVWEQDKCISEYFMDLWDIDVQECIWERNFGNVMFDLPDIKG